MAAKANRMVRWQVIMAARIRIGIMIDIRLTRVVLMDHRIYH